MQAQPSPKGRAQPLMTTVGELFRMGPPTCPGSGHVAIEHARRGWLPTVTSSSPPRSRRREPSDPRLSCCRKHACRARPCRTTHLSSIRRRASTAGAVRSRNNHQVRTTTCYDGAPGDWEYALAAQLLAVQAVSGQRSAFSWHGTMKDFRDLKAWERAHPLTLAIYRATRAFPARSCTGSPASFGASHVRVVQYRRGLWPWQRRRLCSLPADRHGFSQRGRIPAPAGPRSALLDQVSYERLAKQCTEVKRMPTARSRS